jgi:HD superfamily phosphodiesterase
MENRIEILRKYIDNILLNMEDVIERRCGYIHLYEVSNFCTLFALKRNENIELATMVGMLHDIYSYKKMDTRDHAQKGAVLAKEILCELRITNKNETEIICNAILHHSDKVNKHSTFDEILKDADVIQHFLYNTHFPIIEKEKIRLENILEELGIKKLKE